MPEKDDTECRRRDPRALTADMLQASYGIGPVGAKLILRAAEKER